MAEKIVLNNGQEIEGATISAALWNSKLAFITIPGNDLVSMAVLFGNKNNTQKMEYYHTIYKDTFTGYTQISDISSNADKGTIEIWISGDENSHYERGYTVPDEYVPKSIEEKENKENGSNDTNGET